MREIVLDTETTGLDPAAGHRIVEIAGLELLHHVPTGRTFREYINPERDMPEEAEKIHGLSASFLADKPLFAAVAQPFLDFIGDAKLVIHNAQFDMKFLNAELKAVGLPTLPSDRAIDTVAMARKRFPGAQVNLDALCRRFEIDNSARTFHGALLDCELLAEVYLELSGGRQPGLTLERQQQRSAVAAPLARSARPPRPHRASEVEKAAHEKMLEKLTDPIWRQ
ncbi:DNA polymerase III subunit epsilon [Pelagibius sp.]|uniref:DNA polymerase III subunit epsilon n=1 Tax=Pelagibius sp. TaxID=1931238 RepID=UPI003BB22361